MFLSQEIHPAFGQSLFIGCQALEPKKQNDLDVVLVPQALLIHLGIIQFLQESTPSSIQSATRQQVHILSGTEDIQHDLGGSCCLGTDLLSGEARNNSNQIKQPL